MKVLELPRGFLATGRNAGIKNSKPDCGILLSERPAEIAAVVSRNKARAPCLDRIERIRDEGRPVRAILAISGNANALTGPDGRADDETLAGALSDRLGVEDLEVLTSFTGVIGYRPPVERIEGALDASLAELSRNPIRFAESILTTDRATKMATREIFVSGTRVTLHAVAKGSGMVAPSLATMLAFITTDAVIDRAFMQSALRSVVDRTFNQLTVDGEMSTNDAVLILANGAAKNEPIGFDSDAELFLDALLDLCTQLAIAVARDGEGATRLLEVQVTGADSEMSARALSRGIAGSLLVKAAVFGADPNAGARMIASAGGVAARIDVPFELAKARLTIQGTTVVEHGVRISTPKLRLQMNEPEVRAVLDLGLGSSAAFAWGCDLSYDYVKINADYAAITKTADDGSVSVEERLTGLGPTIKKKILIEALRYIDRFRGMRAIVALGGLPITDLKLMEEFAEDVLLLRTCGLRPIVVHGLHPPDDINQRLVAILNRDGSRAVGLYGTDGGLIRTGSNGLELDVTLLDMLEKDAYVPVVAPVGLAEEGRAQDLEADAVASALAVAVGAKKLIFLADVAGIVDGEGLVSELTSDQAKLRLERGEIPKASGGKVSAALSALAGGVARVHLVDGRVPHNLIAELFTDHGVGTLIRRS
jgi:acetylglutamate kinase